MIPTAAALGIALALGSQGAKTYEEMIGLQVLAAATLATAGWHVAAAIVATNVLARGVAVAVLVARDKKDLNHAAKFLRWDTGTTYVAYMAALFAVFTSSEKLSVLEAVGATLGVAYVAAPSLLALGRLLLFRRTYADDEAVDLALRLSRAAYTEPTILDDATDTRVTVVQSDHRVGTVVAFAGTSSRAHWSTNIRVHDTHPSWADCAHPKLRTHAGFARAWASVRDRVKAGIAGAQAVLLCGHSLGGALATLAALDLACDGLPVTVVTFGAPQVGDNLFVKAFDARIQRSIRVVSVLDPVPKSMSAQFRHVKGEHAVVSLTLNPHGLTSYAKAIEASRVIHAAGSATQALAILALIAWLVARHARA
jgi:hypothetical protein